MARLRVFVSSTCYDLTLLRSELRPFIAGLGFEPVMSEYSDILYDPRVHTHDSCVKEIAACDLVVLIIGSRFGGMALPSIVQKLDLDYLKRLSTKTSILDAKDKLSVTQLEVLKAIQEQIPVYVFVDEKVLHDHNVYERNKDKIGVIDQIEFPSIQKPETAVYIFEFINFLTHRGTNNGLAGFSRLDEIRAHLAGQWSQLFQRLLLEDRTRTREERRYRDFSERIEDLKALVLASLATPDLRETAKGALQFRRLISFVCSLRLVDQRQVLLSKCSWGAVLHKADIVEKRQLERRLGRLEGVLVRSDGTFYRTRFPLRLVEEFELDWEAFLRLETAAREAIVDTLLEDREAQRYLLLEFYDMNVDDYIAQRSQAVLRGLERPAVEDDAPDSSG